MPEGSLGLEWPKRQGKQIDHKSTTPKPMNKKQFYYAGILFLLIVAAFSSCSAQQKTGCQQHHGMGGY